MNDKVVRRLWAYLQECSATATVNLENIAMECRATLPAVRKAFRILEEMGLIRIYEEE